ncbi:Asp-tRNA(Asn)/Glu-tRNA(Gln) amidotransferase subunit GatB [Flammeovirgaceae bacterium SG7u.111]|nr:Asp-tRNA(Asn)/Glu-tRNA(Gln) amidotransferase subunit GatB [Flammeovirgaceae bacterium SG7u.132]WPO35747.1 Asp-tRNA(Asn)/Glu-tRNA(Gln) amidotransferase subunit GatB [Flammeovirgaceae bacterium SG7u.111]
MDQAILDKYELVVGLEVHAQLATESKIFSGDSTAFGQPPNTNISVITLAHPGILPKVNKKVIEYAIKMGLACHCEISRYNIFDRKNYFYPDLPKGFQTTQEKHPVCIGGYLEVTPKDGKKVKISLNRIHMEEDAGKSIHMDSAPETQVDLNRAGVPLIEIVTEPDIRTAEQAYLYVNEVRRLVRYLEVCDGNMEEGSVRCDANISVRLKGQTKLGSKVEVKNMNSARNVQRAIDYEFARQVKMAEADEEIISETRTFNANNGKTFSMRSKEQLNDYRYFPEPDLPPIIIEEEYLKELEASLPALPWELFEKFITEYGLPEYDANFLVETKEMAAYFDSVCSHTKNYKAASNWIMGPVKSYLNDNSIEITSFPVAPEQVASLIALVDTDKVSYTVAAQKLFPALIENPSELVEKLAEKLGLVQEDDDNALREIVVAALAKFPDKAEALKKGKKNLLGLFMGEIMKQGKGKINPKKANQMIMQVLAEK